MANSADPDQLASSDLDLHCWQRQDISGFCRTRVNYSKYDSLWPDKNQPESKHQTQVILTAHASDDFM